MMAGDPVRARSPCRVSCFSRHKRIFDYNFLSQALILLHSMFKQFSLTCTIALSTVLVTISVGAAPTANLTASQTTALKSLGIAIVIPSSVPPGYTISKVATKPCPANRPRSEKGTCRFGPEYGIVYRDAKADRCFAIEATGGGIGGVPADYEVRVDTPLFGKVALLFGAANGAFKQPSAQQLAIAQPGLLSDWGGTGPFYRIMGADLVRSAYYGEREGKSVAQCRNPITPNEAIAIMKSLSWLK